MIHRLIALTNVLRPPVESTLVWVLIDVWRFPLEWDGGRWVANGVYMIVAEFFLLHSGVFMAGIALEADPWKRLLAFLFLFAFYGAFVGGMAYLSGSAALFLVFGSVMLGRFVTLVVAVGEGSLHIAERSVYGAILYVVLVPASLFLPVPELGIDHHVAKIAFESGSGVWTQEPERGLAMAIAYFSIMIYLETFKFGRAGNANTMLHKFTED